MINNEMFQRFVGRKVDVDVKTLEFKSNRGGPPVKYNSYQVLDDDETMRDVRELVETCNMKLRVWMPNTVGTMDIDGERVNVHIDAGEDGSYSVTKVYIG